MRQKTYLFMISTSIALLLSLAFVFNYRIIIVSGESMRPEYNDGQIIIADRTFTINDISSGDIVVYNHNGETCIKRVLAMSGDMVKQHDGKLYINDVIEVPYTTLVEDAFVIAENEFYVCGDNFNNSIDSRMYGPIEYEEIDCIIHV